jgi:hypothetical protein
MWIANGNVSGPDDGTLVRVSLDGSDVESFDLPLRHHDVAVLPDEHVAYIEYESGSSEGCDLVKELDPRSGATQTVFTVSTANPASTGGCHSNAIHYWPQRERFTLSVRDWSSIVSFGRTGELDAVFGGAASSWSGLTWDQQHGHQLLGDGLLVFTHDEGEDPGVREYRFADGSASLVWEYVSGLDSPVLGDVQRLPNGNTLVTYSTIGVIQEVTPGGEVAREIELSSPVGYTTFRETLYGPPPD